MKGGRPVRLLGSLGRTLGGAALERLGRTASRIQEARPLRPDLLESDDAYLALFDAPGAAASDVQVRFTNGTVQVRIDRFRDYHEGFEMRYPGRWLSLDGQVRLPRDATVDADAATATLRSNGTLAVRVPKVERDEREVPVDTEDVTE